MCTATQWRLMNDAVDGDLFSNGLAKGHSKMCLELSYVSMLKQTWCHQHPRIESVFRRDRL